MIMAPDSAQARDAGGVFVRPVEIGRARGRCRQVLDVDVILHGNGNAVKRQRFIHLAGESARLGEHVGLLAQGYENRRIVVGADAREAARDNILGLGVSAAISVEDFGDRLGHKSSVLA